MVHLIKFCKTNTVLEFLKCITKLKISNLFSTNFARSYADIPFKKCVHTESAYC